MACQVLFEKKCKQNIRRGRHKRQSTVKADKEQLAYLMEMNEKTAPEAHSTRTANRYSLQSSFDRVPSDTIITNRGGKVNIFGEKYSLPDTAPAGIDDETM